MFLKTSKETSFSLNMFAISKTLKPELLTMTFFLPKAANLLRQEAASGKILLPSYNTPLKPKT